MLFQLRPKKKVNKKNNIKMFHSVKMADNEALI